MTSTSEGIVRRAAPTVRAQKESVTSAWVAE